MRLSSRKIVLVTKVYLTSLLFHGKEIDFVYSSTCDTILVSLRPGILYGWKSMCDTRDSCPELLISMDQHLSNFYIMHPLDQMNYLYKLKKENLHQFDADY